MLFAKGVFALSNPIYVPEGLDDDGVETYRQKLERIANLQAQECDALAGNPVIEPADVYDFKKKEGYKKSTEISKEYEMYRQYYCGCVYSKRDRDREIAEKRNKI